MLIVTLKETRNPYFCVTPKNQAASQVYITFLQVTQKILTKDIIHWLKVIAEILSFLQIFSVRKTTTQFFNISKNLQENRQKKLYSWHILGL